MSDETRGEMNPADVTALVIGALGAAVGSSLPPP